MDRRTQTADTLPHGPTPLEIPQLAGFTLIELMIVIAIIAIIAAIAIPGLLRSTLTSNEKSAMGAMREMTNQMAQWKTGDRDRNGVNDYWTLDISSMYRVEGVPSGSGVPLMYANLDVARADADWGDAASGGPGAGAFVYAINPAPFGAVNVLDGPTALGVPTPVPKAGYLYEALSVQPNGARYTQTIGTAVIPATHISSFGFQATPAVYNASGLNTFIINENSVVFKADTGSGYAAPPVPLNPPHPGLPPPFPWSTID